MVYQEQRQASNGVEIIPGIIKDEWEPLKERLDLLKGKTDWVHVDVSDGIFTPHKTWSNPSDLELIESPPKIEVHLMIGRPLDDIADWLKPTAVGRVIIHQEALDNSTDELISRVHAAGKEIVLAINPETPIEAISSYKSKVNGFLIMGVKPGFSGSPFEPVALEKIASLRQKYPNVTIEIDGGVNRERAPEFVRAGANRLVSTSFIESFANPSDGIEQLRASLAG